MAETTVPGRLRIGSRGWFVQTYLQPDHAVIGDAQPDAAEVITVVVGRVHGCLLHIAQGVPSSFVSYEAAF